MSAKPVKRAVDAHIRLDIRDRDLPWIMPKDGESKAQFRERGLGAWASDFREFLRDHRSRDVNMLDVVMEYETVCSECEREWETQPPDADNPNTTCAYCGAYVSGPSPPQTESPLSEVKP